MEKQYKEKRLFRALVVDTVRYTADVKYEIPDVRFVFDKYGEFFTFEKSVDKEEIERTTRLIAKMFIYLFPTVGSSTGERLAQVVASANEILEYKLVVDESGYEEIYEAIKGYALDSDRVVKELAKYGLDLSRFLKD